MEEDIMYEEGSDDSDTETSIDYPIGDDMSEESDPRNFRDESGGESDNEDSSSEPSFQFTNDNINSLIGSIRRNLIAIDNVDDQLGLSQRVEIQINLFNELIRDPNISYIDRLEAIENIYNINNQLLHLVNLYSIISNLQLENRQEYIILNQALNSSIENSNNLLIGVTDTDQGIINPEFGSNT